MWSSLQNIMLRVRTLTLKRKIDWWGKNTKHMSTMQRAWPELPKSCPKESSIRHNSLTQENVNDWERIETVDKECYRKKRQVRESWWMRRIEGQVINRNEESYDLPHIYDVIIQSWILMDQQKWGEPWPVTHLGISSTEEIDLTDLLMFLFEK